MEKNQKDFEIPKEIVADSIVRLRNKFYSRMEQHCFYRFHLKMNM